MTNDIKNGFDDLMSCKAETSKKFVSLLNSIIPCIIGSLNRFLFHLIDIGILQYIVLSKCVGILRKF